MGYTHYWREVSSNETAWEKLCEVTNKIISEFESRNPGTRICGPSGEGAPVVTEDHIGFNGDDAADASCESLFLERGCSGFEFCKTWRLPYDTVAVAVLMAATHLGVLQNGWSSDACYIAELQDGLDLLRAVVLETVAVQAILPDVVKLNEEGDE